MAARTPVTKTFDGAVDEGRVGPDETIAVITTDRVDRDGEVVVPSGIDLSAYRRNPIVMYGHAKGVPVEGEYGLPVGTNLWIKPTSDMRGLVAKTKFDIDDPTAAKVCGKVKRGVLRACSITFIPKSYGPPTREEIARRPDWADAKRIYREVELVEYSIVAAPANPDAEIIAKARKPEGESAPKYEEMCAAAKKCFGGMAHGKGASLHAHEGRMVIHHVMGDGEMTPDEIGKAYDEVPHADGVMIDREEPAKGFEEIAGCGKSCPCRKGDDEGGDEKEKAEGDEDGEDAAAAEDPAGRDKEREKAAGASGGASAMSETSGALGGFAIGGRGEVIDHDRRKDEAEGVGDPADGPDEVEESGGIRRYSYVKCLGGMAHKSLGRVHSIHTRGMVPHCENDAMASADDPHARVQLYKAYGDGHVPTDVHVAHPVSRLERADDLKPPTKKPMRPDASKPGEKPAKATPAPAAQASPLTPAEVFDAHAMAILRSPEFAKNLREWLHDAYDVARGKV